MPDLGHSSEHVRRMKKLMTDREWVLKDKIITIVRGQSPDAMLHLADALLAGGVTLLEVTFQQHKPEAWQDTCRAIEVLSRQMQGRMLIGAGTVMTQEQLQMAKQAGARYIVTPNTNPDLIRKVKAEGLCCFPGALTPTEIVNAWEAGADAIKVFPAGDMGPAYFKSLTAPLSHIPLMAVAGINLENVEAFMKAGAAGLGISSCLANPKWISEGAWEQITANAARFRQIVDRYA